MGGGCLPFEYNGLREESGVGHLQIVNSQTIDWSRITIQIDLHDQWSAGCHCQITVNPSTILRHADRETGFGGPFCQRSGYLQISELENTKQM